jgi:hypothetical protein
MPGSFRGHVLTGCERFENEGLPRFVAGEPLEPHFEECADCRAARVSYQAVASALQQAKDAYAPPGDWEAKVWARIRQAQSARRWRAVLGFSAAAAALAVFFLASAGGPEALTLSTDFERGSGPVVRGGAARGGDVLSLAPGDVLRVGVKVPRGKRGDVRVYRDTNELVFQCATNPACRQVKDGFEAPVTLDRTGTYRAVGIAADKLLPAATGNLDVDYAAAMRSCDRPPCAQESRPIDVR